MFVYNVYVYIKYVIISSCFQTMDMLRCIRLVRRLVSADVMSPQLLTAQTELVHVFINCHQPQLAATVVMETDQLLSAADQPQSIELTLYQVAKSECLMRNGKVWSCSVS